MGRVGRRKCQAEAYRALCLGLASHRFHYLGMRSALRKKSKNLNTPSLKNVFPRPQKAVERSGTFTLPSAPNWRTEENSFEETVRFFAKRIGLSEIPDSGNPHLVVEREILACPETKEPVQLAEAELITELNSRIERGELKNRAGRTLENAIDGGLVREDGAYLYPIEDAIPIMLIDEAIPLN